MYVYIIRFSHEHWSTDGVCHAMIFSYYIRINFATCEDVVDHIAYYILICFLPNTYM